VIPDRFKRCLFVLFFLAACASTPISRYEDIARNFKVPKGHALLYLYREGLGGIAGHDQVIIDAKRTLDVTHDGYYVIELSPGTHTIQHTWVALGVRLGMQHTRHIKMEAGKWYWLNFWSLDTFGRNTKAFSQAVSDINSLDFIDYYDMSEPHESVAKLRETEARLHVAEAKLRKTARKSGKVEVRQHRVPKQSKVIPVRSRISAPAHSNAPAVARDDEATFQHTLTLAKQGDIEAQYLTGQMYRKGLGIRKNDNSASKWYRLAAEQGNIQAQMRLGFMYRNGDGVRQDNVEAIRWYRLAAEQGYPKARFYLGLMYESGMGIRRDHTEAMKLYRKSAEQGFATAQLYLGAIYSHGAGVGKDEAEAVKWYRKAADQNIASAQFNLGTMYAEGRGVQQSAAAATDWFYKAGLGYLKEGEKDDALRSAERIKMLQQRGALPNAFLGDKLMKAIYSGGTQ